MSDKNRGGPAQGRLFFSRALIAISAAKYITLPVLYR